MIQALIDGSTRPANKLALPAGVSPSSVSGHPGRLVEGGVLNLKTRGRNRFYRLARPGAGQAVEALASASLVLQSQRCSLSPSHDMPSALREARTCYDHLAGGLAVDVFAQMLDAGWIEQEGRMLRLSATSEAGLARLRIDLAEVHRRHRQLACACPDWGERKPYLGGALGAALLEAYLRQGWLRPQDGLRTLQVSPKGHVGPRGLAGCTAD